MNLETAINKSILLNMGYVLTSSKCIAISCCHCVSVVTTRSNAPWNRCLSSLQAPIACWVLSSPIMSPSRQPLFGPYQQWITFVIPVR